MSVFFGGRLLTTPQTASVVNDDAMRNQNPATGNVAALIGMSAGGKPKVGLSFGSPQDAITTLVSGELLDAVLAAFDPSSETAGPSTVIALRVQPALQSTLTVNGAGSIPVVTVTSNQYGALANQIRLKVEAGSIEGRRYTVQLGNSYYTTDNVARGALSVQYVGAAASATLSITPTTLTLQAPTGTAVATLNLADFPTVQSVVDRLNTVPSVTASVLGNFYTAVTAAGLDTITAVDVKTAAYTVRADLQAFVDWLNSSAQPFVTGARVAGAGLIPAIADFAYLSGGTDGTSTNNDWAQCFEALQSLDVQYVSPVSADPAIHAMADAHVAFMSGPNGRKERRAFVGSDVGTSDVEAIARAKALNSDRTALIHLGEYNYNAAGALVLYPPYILAARVAGAFSGINPGTPLTNKTLKIRGIERKLRNPVDTDVLIRGGVFAVEDTAEGYKVVQSISTWLTDTNYNRIEVSTGVALDYTVRSVRDALDVLRGQKGNPLVLQRAISITDATLRACALAEPQGPGVIVAYRNITASIVADTLRVQYECSPVIGVNFILNTVYAVPFSGVATAA
jgi:hypothetical protein